MRWSSYFKKVAVAPYEPDGASRVVVRGVNDTLHSKDVLTGKTIPNVRLTETVDMLGIANLALGVINLGVGLYNAHKIQSVGREVITQGVQTRREVRRVQRSVAQTHETLLAGLGYVDRVLQYQNEMLHELEAHHRDHRAQLDVLIARLDAGFERMEKNAWQITDDRRNDEYLILTTTLSMAKRKAAEALAFRGQMTPTECADLRRRAGDLQAWVDNHLQHRNLHKFMRQPYVFAYLNASITENDVLMFEDPDGNCELCRHRFNQLIELVQAEVRRLHDKATPWEVMTIVREQVAGYAMIHRGLTLSLEMLGARPEEAPVEVRAWDDALPDPIALSSSTPQARLLLESEADRRWMFDAFELDGRDPAYATVREVPTRLIKRRLGIWDDAVDPSTLKPYLKEDVWEGYNQTIRDEFGFNPRVRPIKVPTDALLAGHEIIAKAGPDDIPSDFKPWSGLPLINEVSSFLLKFKWQGAPYELRLDFDGQSRVRVELRDAEGHCEQRRIKLVHPGRLGFFMKMPAQGAELHEFQLSSENTNLTVSRRGRQTVVPYQVFKQAGASVL